MERTVLIIITINPNIIHNIKGNFFFDFNEPFVNLQ